MLASTDGPPCPRGFSAPHQLPFLISISRQGDQKRRGCSCPQSLEEHGKEQGRSTCLSEPRAKLINLYGS